MWFEKWQVLWATLCNRLKWSIVAITNCAQYFVWELCNCGLYYRSGVTRVGDTRGGNWGCHPSIFSWKTWRPFFAHRCYYHCRFLLLSLGCHPLEGVTLHLFLPVRPRFSTILCKFAHNFFPSGVTPWRVPPHLPSDATEYYRVLLGARMQPHLKNWECPSSLPSPCLPPSIFMPVFSPFLSTFLSLFTSPLPSLFYCSPSFSPFSGTPPL